MSDSAEEIVQRMQHVRREVGDDVKGIVETAKTLTDWRYHVKHHPWMCLGAAVAMGFFLAPRKRKIPSADAKELVALLKKYNVGVAAPSAAGNSLTRTLLGMAAPLVMRSVMSAAGQRFGGQFGPPPPNERARAYEDIHVPR
jgi:hypothetical protein